MNINGDNINDINDFFNFKIFNFKMFLKIIHKKI